MSNMRHWEKLHKPPLTALKPIAAGRMKGKSDINPMWRIQAFTEQFGPCGVGWKYTIDKLWTETGDGVQVCAFALVSVYYKDDGEWSAPLPGIGGSMLIAQESQKPYTSDEAYKMAVTDALSVAMKSLGVAAEIYLGNFDGSKYTGSAAGTHPTPPSKTEGSPMPQANQQLHDDLAAHCMGDLEKMDTLLKRLSYYKSGDKEYSFGLDRLAGTSEKWITKVHKTLKAHIQAETQAAKFCDMCQVDPCVCGNEA